MTTRLQATRRTVLSAAAVTPFAAPLLRPGAPAFAGAPNILKPLPADRFYDYGTNAEMRWDSVDPERYLTPQRDLFVRNHTSTPVIDPATYTLPIFGDGLAERRSRADAHVLTLSDLKAMPRHVRTTVHECTGNGRSFFTSQQDETVSGTPWKLGSVGAVRWEGVRLRHVLRRIGLSPRAVSVMATGLDDEFVSGETNYGRVRRPFSIDKALDDAILAWRANGQDLLPDHGFPLRLVLPGWIGIASIKWLGSLQVARRELTSPWNTTFYRMTGGDYPADSPPLTVNPVRSAWELPWEATITAGARTTLTGRSWSGAGPIRKVEVSLDGGATWRKADLVDPNGRAPQAGPADSGTGWTRWTTTWRNPRPGTYELLARATDREGRTQPDVTPYNSQGYFFDAVVRHPVTVA